MGRSHGCSRAKSPCPPPQVSIALSLRYQVESQVNQTLLKLRFLKWSYERLFVKENANIALCALVERQNAFKSIEISDVQFQPRKSLDEWQNVLENRTSMT